MKARAPYLAAMIIAMILGYGSRSYAEALPAFVAAHFGDALWASMVYFGIRVLWPTKTIVWPALIGIVFCFGIELSQLYQAEWIHGIRSTFLGALVLGSGFVTVDLVRYTAGIALAAAADGWIIRKRIG
ncbi:DUF2809 domain-containing protein [Paenibacillus sp. LPE1-1-1.1]|uniref:ribosomal maturation YjgA family protein n=1 Tax=Paenibacillus sp. LPE1-1-1.1 TaxID=3135230 RepID=UPI00344937B7